MIDFQNEPTRPLPPGIYVGERELRLDPRLTCPHCGRGLRPGDGRETGHGLQIICGGGHLLQSWE
jgi:hypothetical protein